MTTPLLSITEIANSQVNQYATANEAFRDLESETNGELDIDLSSANVTLTDAQFRGYQVYRGTGHGSTVRTISMPAITSPIATESRVMTFVNDGTAQIAILCTNSAIPVLPGCPVRVHYDGLNFIILSGHITRVDYTSLVSPLASSPTPDAGLVYIVGSGSPQGLFAGQDGNLAVSRGDNTYSFVVPFDGQIVRTRDLGASPHVVRAIMWNADTSAWIDV